MTEIAINKRMLLGECEGTPEPQLRLAIQPRIEITLEAPKSNIGCRLPVP